LERKKRFSAEDLFFSRNPRKPATHESDRVTFFSASRALRINSHRNYLIPDGDTSYYIHTLQNSANHRVLLIKRWLRAERDVKLAARGVNVVRLPRHCYDTGRIVL
jgi:hypothetical protein